MSKESRRLGREEIKELRKQRKKAAKALREKQQAQGLLAPVKVAMPNRKSAYKNVEEESRYSGTRRLPLNRLEFFAHSCRCC